MRIVWTFTALAMRHRAPTVPLPILRAIWVRVNVPVNVSLCLNVSVHDVPIAGLPGQRRQHRRKTNDESGHGDDHRRPLGALGAGRSRNRGLLFRAVAGYRFLPEGPLEYWRRFLPRRPRNDRLDRWPQFSLRKPGRTGADGLGRR